MCTFLPVEVRQFEIAKASGKLRKLGILTVTDLVVQAVLKLVLGPTFEAVFAPCSCGLRPNRRAQDVIVEVHHFTTKSYHWVLEADIEACFDTGTVARVGDTSGVALKDLGPGAWARCRFGYAASASEAD